MTGCPIINRNDVEVCSCTAGNVLRLLSNTRRRTVVSVLERSERDSMDVDRLVSTLADEHTDVSAETWKMELHHRYLPALEDGDVIEYDSRSGTVRYYRCKLIADVLAAVEANCSRR